MKIEGDVYETPKGTPNARTSTVIVTTRYAIRGPVNVVWIRGRSVRSDGPACEVQLRAIGKQLTNPDLDMLDLIDKWPGLNWSFNPKETRTLDWYDVRTTVGNEFLLKESLLVDPKGCARVEVVIRRD